MKNYLSAKTAEELAKGPPPQQRQGQRQMEMQVQQAYISGPETQNGLKRTLEGPWSAQNLHQQNLSR